MWKKLLSAVIAALMALALVCPAITASADEVLSEGDTVRYIFSMGECENAAGIAVDSFYSTEYLRLDGEPEFLIEGQGLVNSSDEGIIKWNTMLNGGREFSGEDILIETFTVCKKCTIEDLALSFDCREIFSHELISLPVDLVSARIETVTSDTDRDETDSVVTDEETPIKEDTSSKAETSSRESSSSARIYPHVEVTTTDLTTSEDAETLDPDSDQPTTAASSRTRVTSSRIKISGSVSSKAESEASSKAESAVSSKAASSSSKNETTTTPDKNDKTSSRLVSSATASSITASVSSGAKATPEAPTSKSASSATASLTARSTSTVQTAGRIVIAALAAILVAAAATVFLTKKIKTEE